MKSGRRPESPAEKRARLTFTANVVERGRCELKDLIPHECDGEGDACHFIPKQFLKDWAITLCLSPEETLAMVWDERNALAGCRLAHLRFDGPYNPVTADQIPTPVIEFAQDYDLTWWLEKNYLPEEDQAA